MAEIDTDHLRARLDRIPDSTHLMLGKSEVAALADALDTARRERDEARAALARANDYRPDGNCRACGGGGGRNPRPHSTWCRLYTGPVEHRWANIAINGTFGGIDHFCACGGWFRQGGIAGHGDGTDTAKPVCPKADETHRGSDS